MLGQFAPLSRQIHELFFDLNVRESFGRPFVWSVLRLVDCSYQFGRESVPIVPHFS
ncbi:MAG: hypothetical protein WBL84_09620 [Xanthobacteraceae bacterium]